MQILTKGIYYYKVGANVQLWHDCKQYKDRDKARVELQKIIETEDIMKFQCPFCGFQYDFDKNLNLPASTGTSLIR